MKEFLGEITANESKGMAKVTPSRLKISDRAHLGKIIYACLTTNYTINELKKVFSFQCLICIGKLMVCKKIQEIKVM